ncbi:MAG: hypothetical protein D6814_03000, partial [Calditrichaeota bacterium]
MLLYAALSAGVGLLVFMGGQILLLSNRIFSNGPLASAHAFLQQNCTACHVPFKSEKSKKCQDCHARSRGQVRRFTFAAHYGKELPASRAAQVKRYEMPCAGCHPEHRGSEASLVAVADKACLPCHAFGAFTRRHPQFASVVREIANEDHLQFSHILHVEEVQKEEGIARQNVERVCLTCHT